MTDETETPEPIDEVSVETPETTPEPDIAPEEDTPPASLAEAIERDYDALVAKGEDEDSSDDPKDEAAETDDQEDEGEEAPQAESIEAPAHWSAETKAKFDSLTDDAKASVLEMAKSQEADYTRKTQELATQRKTAEPLLNFVESDDVKMYLSEIGMEPTQAFSILLSTEKQLRTGTDADKRQALQGLANSYGVSLQPGERNGPQADPVISQLEAKLAQVTQRLQSFESNSQEMQRQTVDEQIAEFRDAKDEAGQPMRPHFEAVEADMARLIQSDPSMTLQDAYDRSVWANPETRQALLDGQTKAARLEADKRAKEARRKISGDPQPKRAGERAAKSQSVRSAAELAWEQAASG